MNEDNQDLYISPFNSTTARVFINSTLAAIAIAGCRDSAKPTQIPQPIAVTIPAETFENEIVLPPQKLEDLVDAEISDTNPENIYLADELHLGGKVYSNKPYTLKRIDVDQNIIGDQAFARQEFINNLEGAALLVTPNLKFQENDRDAPKIKLIAKENIAVVIFRDARLSDQDLPEWMYQQGFSNLNKEGIRLFLEGDEDSQKEGFIAYTQSFFAGEEITIGANLPANYQEDGLDNRKQENGNIIVITGNPSIFEDAQNITP